MVHVARIVETLHVDFALVIIDQIIKFQRIKAIFFGPLPSKLISWFSWDHDLSQNYTAQLLNFQSGKWIPPF